MYPNVECGSNSLFLEEGAVVSPDWPDAYPSDFDCETEIFLLSAGNKIRLEFVQFDVQGNENDHLLLLELNHFHLSDRRRLWLST